MAAARLLGSGRQAGGHARQPPPRGPWAASCPVSGCVSATSRRSQRAAPGNPQPAWLSPAWWWTPGRTEWWRGPIPDHAGSALAGPGCRLWRPLSGSSRMDDPKPPSQSSTIRSYCSAKLGGLVFTPTRLPNNLAQPLPREANAVTNAPCNSPNATPEGRSRAGPDRPEAAAFARKLHLLMLQRGLSQSDLARSVWGTTTDKAGRNVAKNRDRISEYVRAQSLPDPHNLKKLADALGISPDQLAADHVAAAIDSRDTEIAMTSEPGNGGFVRLRLNKRLPAGLAAQVFALISSWDEGKKA